MEKIKIKELILIITIFFLLIISWIPSKYIGKIIFIQLIFLLISFIPVIFCGTTWGLNWLRLIFGRKYIGIKFCILVFAILRGYIILVGLNPKLSDAVNKEIIAPLHGLVLKFLAPFIIFIFIIFQILNTKSKNVYKKDISARDLLVLGILFCLSFFQMTWHYPLRNDLLILSKIFYLHVLFMIWIFVNLPLVLFLIQRRFSNQDIGFVLNIKWRDLKYFLCFGSFFIVFTLVLYVLNYQPFFPDSWILWVMKFTYFTFIIALPAELLYRGLFISFLSNKFKNTILYTQRNVYAVAISSFLFGLTHYWAGLPHIFIEMAFGILLGIIFLKTRGLFAPTLIHSVVAMISSRFLFFG